MRFTFHCPFCKAKLEGQEEWLGMESQCPSCSKIIIFKKDDDIPTNVPADQPVVPPPSSATPPVGSSLPPKMTTNAPKQQGLPPIPPSLMPNGAAGAPAGNNPPMVSVNAAAIGQRIVNSAVPQDIASGSFLNSDDGDSNFMQRMTQKAVTSIQNEEDTVLRLIAIGKIAAIVYGAAGIILSLVSFILTTLNIITAGAILTVILSHLVRFLYEAIPLAAMACVLYALLSAAGELLKNAKKSAQA